MNTGNKWTYYHPECKQCTKEREKKRQEANKDEYLEYLNNYYHTNKKTGYWKKKNEGYYSVESEALEKKRKREKKWQKNNPDRLKDFGQYRKLHKTHKLTIQEWDACRLYFNYRCAYCGITYEDQYKINKQDFHKEHVDHEGSNDLSNCIPACRSCNVKKNTFAIDEWYNENNSVYSIDRYKKILKWLNEDYKHYITAA